MGWRMGMTDRESKSGAPTTSIVLSKSISREQPKSAIFALKPSSTRMFSGFKSPWTTGGFCPCRYAIARAMPTAMGSLCLDHDSE